MIKGIKKAVRSLALLVALCATGGAWATDYTYSNVDRDSLATTSDASYRITSLTFALNNPSVNYATSSFPESGYVQLTSISIAARSSGYMDATSATLTNNKTSESYSATVTHVSNNFTADLPFGGWTRTEVHVAFGADGVFVDTTATYTLTFNCETGCSVVNKDGAGWKPAMRIYGRTPSGSMEFPSSLIPSSGGVSLPSTVTVSDATNIAFANDSITVGNGGISVALSPALSYHTVMVKVSNIPSSSSRLIGWMTGQLYSQDIENCAYYDGSSFNQCYFLGGTDKGNYNTGTDNRAWTRDASEHWVAASYARKDSESGCSQTSGGTRTYFDGAEKVTSTGLKWGSYQTSKITIGGTSTNSGNPATGMVIKDVIIFSDALTADQIATVTAALNKGWTVDASGTTITSATLRELPKDANVLVKGSLSVATDGACKATASTEQVQVLAGGSFNIGTARPTIAGVEAGGTLAVTMDVTFSDRIAGYTPSATLTVTDDLDGTVTLNGDTITPVVDGGTATLTGTAVAGNPTYTGNGWWWDYEFTGNGNNIGSEGTALSWDGDRAFKNNEYTTADETGNQMLHLPARPWRDVSSYPTEFTAVMFCKAGATANGVLVSFGSTTHGSYKTITLSTGANPSAGQMRLVYGSGQDSSTDLVAGGFTLDNITSANHLYAFTVKTVDEVSQITVYADGELLATYKADSLITLGTGFQIASGHGGLPHGLSRLANDDAATMDFLRVSNEALSSAAIKAMAAVYRYVSPNGIAERTLSANATWTDETNTSWSQKTLNEDGSTTTTAQAAPNSGTVVEITASTDVRLTMDLDSEVSYEKVTFQGDGAITVKAGGTAPTVTTRTYINTDVTMDIAAFASLGAITIADGKTLTIVPDEEDTLAAGIALGVRGETSTIATGTVSLGTDSQVVLPASMVSDFAGYGFTLTLTRDASDRYVYTIARADNPVHITKRATGAVVYAMYPDAMSGQSAMFTLPEEPATIPEDFASSVTIVNNHASESLTVATAFAGGAVPVTVSAGSSPVVLSGNSTFGGTVTLNGATTISGTSTFSGAVSGSGTLTVSGTVTVASTGSVANAVEGDGRMVFERALPSSNLKTSFQNPSTWTGTVELKNYTHPSNSDFGIIKFNDYGTSSSAIALNNVTSLIFTGNTAYPNVTLRELEICEGGWTDLGGAYTIDPTYTADLTGNGTITIKTGGSEARTVKFIGNHTFNGSVTMDSGTQKQVAFMKTSSDTLYSVTAKAIVVAGGLDMSIASGKTWSASGGIKIDGSLTVLTSQKGSATSGTISAYQEDAQIDEIVDATEGTTMYRGYLLETTINNSTVDISDNHASIGGVTVVGDSSISGSGGAFMRTLTIEDGATLTYDPVITPIRLKSAAPVFNGSGKLKLASRYAGVTCGKFHLVTYPSESFDEYSEEALKALVDSSSFNNTEYTVSEVKVSLTGKQEDLSVASTDLWQLVLKVGDYDEDAKDVSIAQFGDSITEGIWRNGDYTSDGIAYRGTPNYRIPLMQLLEAYGYRPEARGYREIGSMDANGVLADDNYKWHTGISAQRIYTGGSIRAGFMESIEAHLEQVGVTDIITLKIGTNDAISNESADNMFEGWSNLVWKIVRMRPTSKIVVCAPINIHDGRENNAPGLRQKIAEYVNKTPDQGGFPANQVTLINGSPDGSDNYSGTEIIPADDNYYMIGSVKNDRVHPNWNGHLRLANAWLPAVTNAIESMNGIRAAAAYTAQTLASASALDELKAYRAGYVKLATFTNFNAKLSAWDESPYVSVNEAYTNVPMRRVAYFVARKTTTSPDTRYVWVDMDADETTGTTLAEFGVPRSASINGVVTNLHIYSNSSAIENVAPTVSGVRGTLMRTEKGVNKGNGISTDLVPDGPYGFDWNDTIDEAGAWGVMNMARIFDGVTPTPHRKLLAAQMLFDFNGFNGGRQNALGLGNFAVHGPYLYGNGAVKNYNLNWSFTTGQDEMPTMDARALESGVIEIWGKPAWGTIFSVF